MGGYRGRLVTATLFVLIVLVAVFFRFAYLKDTPPGLYPDEAVNGTDAVRANETGDYRFFYPANNGREGLFINLQALAVRQLGNEPWVLRSVSAVFGVLAVIGIFFLTRRLWGTRTALIASYLTTVSFWAVNFSRIGFRANMLPAILAWSFYFLWVGFKRERSWAFGVAGLVFGVGMHSYISWRLAPILIVAFFALLFAYRAYDRRRLARWFGLFVLGALITASPLLLYYGQHPQDFMGRAGQVSIFAEDSPARALGSGIIKTLGMFTVSGDQNFRHNLAGRPELYFPVGVAFLVGLVLCAGALFRKRKLPEQFLLLWFFVLLVPNFLAPEGAPHALRALGALPAVMMIAALGMEWFYQRLTEYFARAARANTAKAPRVSRIQRELAVLGVLLLALVGIIEAKTYFVDWGLRREVRDAFEQRLVDIGNYLEITTFPRYVVVNESGVLIEGVPVQAQTIKFITGERGKDITYLNTSELDTLPASLESGVVLMTREDPALLAELTRRYPKGIPWNMPPFFGVRVIEP
jgi:4-amino-4-deoxy-L-arabinose transferase-like glycosyltransferase